MNTMFTSGAIGQGVSSGGATAFLHPFSPLSANLCCPTFTGNYKNINPPPHIREVITGAYKWEFK